MATTGTGSAHRHKTKAGYWSDRTDADSGSLHTHPVDLTQYALNTALGTLRVEMTLAINDLKARLSKLEPITFSFTTKP